MCKKKNESGLMENQVNCVKNICALTNLIFASDTPSLKLIELEMDHSTRHSLC